MKSNSQNDPFCYTSCPCVTSLVHPVVEQCIILQFFPAGAKYLILVADIPAPTCLLRSFLFLLLLYWELIFRPLKPLNERSREGKL